MADKRGSAKRNAYGDELRERREAKGWTQQKLGTEAVMSRSHIAHIEAGRRLPSPEDAQRLDQALDTGGVFVRFLPDGKLATFFEEVAELEPQAVMIREYASSLVPGLLQTEAYARAVFAAGFPRLSEEQCADNIRTRLDRAKILDGSLTPEVWAMFDESVLRRPIGGPSVMAGQLRHIAHLGEKRVRLHVLPFSSGAHALLESAVTLMRFEDMAPIAYVEGLHTGTVLDSPAVVEQSLVSYDLALGDALSHQESLALIRAVAEEYEHAQR
ncbi:helix-turn-helix domain-containing protein [Streptomyces gobiensis]|uniref:helix-turn-helix domain-containing protein n=1 Tax=Streptomyces gobiensis TaxID=2875706 RepID=UPI001E46317E|nr:helix-turn-helix transcriptional regulator [Streptomyces gobiensis]UGY94405.1 helix-turn-helix transcriptional regulator [Streptomyces gobiensis]